MNKTPVSILQEMMMKRKIIPNYELTFDGGGTHDNTFIYQVSCDGLVAIGKGRCKKDAKHEAAKAILEKIVAVRNYPQLPATPEPSPIKKQILTAVEVSPKRAPNMPFSNSVGALTALCSENNIQLPVYEEVSDIGPPHARIFTIRCIVSTFLEEGVATTKKQAKHEAARKMLEKIEDVVDDLRKSYDVELEQRLNQSPSDDKIIDRYSFLTKMPSRRINFGVKMAKYHSHLKMSLTDSGTLDSFLSNLKDLNDCINAARKEVTEEDVEDMRQKFIDILKSFNMFYVSRSLESLNSKKYLVLVQISTNPDIVEIGEANSAYLAEWDGIKKNLKVLLILLS